MEKPRIMYECDVDRRYLDEIDRQISARSIPMTMDEFISWEMSLFQARKSPWRLNKADFSSAQHSGY